MTTAESTTPLRVEFTRPAGGPPRLICEAEIVFDGPGPLQGLKLVGFGLWRGTGSEAYVTFPSRSYGRPDERRYFELLRPTGARESAHRLKQFILAEYQRTHGLPG